MAGWIDRLLAAIGMGGRKAEADVSYDPAQAGPKRDDTTLGDPADQQFQGAPGGSAERAPGSEER
jgi:hypothetical protein